MTFNIIFLCRNHVAVLHIKNVVFETGGKYRLKENT